MFDGAINRLSDVKRLFKTNAIFYVLSTLILTAFLVIMGILFTLHSTTGARENSIKDVYEGKQLYTIVDNFYDADGFYEFRQHSQNINYVAEFYNALMRSPNLEFISMFDQPIYIDKFQGDGQFLYHSQGFIDANKNVPVNVKAIQLNIDSFELYQLNVAQGSYFDWGEIDYNKDTLPILLGSDYESVYDIGNTFKGNYYGRNITFEVIGILEPNTFIYYKGDPEFYLDKYLVVPYPEFCEHIKEVDFHFEGILYFAMINGDVVTTLGEKAFLKEVKYIADTTRFVEFSVIGIPDFTLKYDSMVSVIKENQSLLFVTMLLMGILVIFIQYGMGHLILERRLEVYKAYWLMGDDNYRLLYFRDISVPYMLAYLFSVIIMVLYFQGFTLMYTMFTLVISVSILSLVYLTCKRSLINGMIKLM